MSAPTPGGAKKRDLIADIEARRKRSDHLDSRYVSGRFYAVKRAFTQLGETPDRELLRYFPIAIVACIQGFIRGAIAALVDHGEPYLQHAGSSNAIKERRFTYSDLVALHGRRISAGELVGALFPVNSLEDVDVALSATLGRGFLKSLANVVDRRAVELLGQPANPIIADPSRIYGDVSVVFRVRHIFAHEIASREVLEREQTQRLLDSAELFLAASEALIGDELEPNAPLTQTDRNIAARESAASAKRELADKVKRWLKLRDPADHSTFMAVQATWEAYRDAAAAYEAGPREEGGTMWPTIYGGVIEELTRERSKYLEREIQMLSFLNEVDPYEGPL